MTSTPLPAIRLATKADLPAINSIYNHYVLHSTCTYQMEPETMEGRRAWLSNRRPQHPVFVAERAGELLGWGALSPYSLRGGWRFTVEDSIYLADSARRQGVGRLLLGHLLAVAAKNGFHSVVARISAEQVASVGLHAALGFVEVGRMCEVGRKFDQWLDVVYMQKRVGGGEANL